LLTDRGFWIATSERAIKTFCQALVALFVAGVTVLTIDWQQGLAVAATAAVVSVLTSIASYNVGSFLGPSLVDEAVVLPDEDDDL
jgi:L-lactate permease